MLADDTIGASGFSARAVSFCGVVELVFDVIPCTCANGLTGAGGSMRCGGIGDEAPSCVGFVGLLTGFGFRTGTNDNDSVFLGASIFFGAAGFTASVALAGCTTLGSDVSVAGAAWVPLAMPVLPLSAFRFPLCVISILLPSETALLPAVRRLDTTGLLSSAVVLLASGLAEGAGNNAGFTSSAALKPCMLSQQAAMLASHFQRRPDLLRAEELRGC
jgi:hypothetical protein